MVSKVDYQTYMSELESYWVPLSYGFVPHVSKKLSNLPLYMFPPLFDYGTNYRGQLKVYTRICVLFSLHLCG